MLFKLRRLAAASLVLGSVGLNGCQAAGPAPLPSAERAAIRATLDELYEAFCFDPREEPDWAAQRRLFAAGAVFVPPCAPGERPRVVGSEEFLADFREFVRSPPLSETGFHERIEHASIDRFGTVAHAYVVFEGFAPGEPTSRRGLDSIQLVRDGDDWLIVSFTTQYETADVCLPERFLR